MKDTKNICTISHGKFNYPASSGTVYISAINPGQVITAGFVMPSKLYKENKNMTHYRQAHTSGKKELGGFSLGTTIEIPNGSIIKIVNNRKRNGRDYLNACLIVLVHERAGMIDIRGSLPTDPKNAIGEYIDLFSGKGIVLSNAEVESLGFELQSMFKSKYRNADELQEGFTVHKLTNGTPFEDFTSIKRANNVIDISAKRQVRKRKITLI